MSTIASLIVSLRLFANALTKRKRVSLCAMRPTDILTHCGHWQSSSEIRTNFSPCPRRLSFILPTMLPSSHRHGRACRAPRIELQMSSAQTFGVHVAFVTVTSIDPARCEQSRKIASFLTDEEVIQTTRMLETLRNLQDISHRNNNLSHLWLC